MLLPTIIKTAFTGILCRALDQIFYLIIRTSCEAKAVNVPKIWMRKLSITWSWMITFWLKAVWPWTWTPKVKGILPWLYQDLYHIENCAWMKGSKKCQTRNYLKKSWESIQEGMEGISNPNPLSVEAHRAGERDDLQGNALSYTGLYMGTSFGRASLSSCFLTSNRVLCWT